MLAHQGADVLLVPHLDEFPVARSKDLLAAHLTASGRNADQLERAGVVRSWSNAR